jgi:type IV fimbrial biogenesis protein FimT
MKNSRGFTLVELMVALAIAAIVLTFGVPSFRDFIMNARITSQANEFVASVQLARSSAVKQQRDASICISTTYNNNPPTCTGGTDWTNGWVVWVDQDRDGTLDNSEVLRVTAPFAGDSTLTSGARNQFKYAATGLVDNQDTLTLCDSRTQETGRQINIQPSGRVNISNFGGCS